MTILKHISGIITILMFCVLSSKAQTVITGVVSDGNNPLKTVIIKVVSNRKTLAFTTTDKTGRYSVRIPQQNADFIISAELLGYERIEKVVSRDVRTCNFVLNEKSHELKEVVVKASQISQRGDTLSYNVKAFTTVADYTLKDVLNRLPGIDLTQDGGIKYMGKDISHFYIDDMDLLGGKYNIATENIPADYVNSVQIYDHHQPIKMNKGMFSDDVALNIKLDNKAKFKPVGTIESAIGISSECPLYKVTGAGMLFANKTQTIATAKIGNVSSFSERDAVDHFSSNIQRNLSENIMGSISSSMPPLALDRYSYPRDQHYSLNNSRKIGIDKSLRIGAGFVTSYGHHSYNDSKHYYMGDSIMQIEQNKDYSTSTKMPYMSLEYKSNSSKAFLANSFSARAFFSSSELPTTRNSSIAYQDHAIDSYNISNNFVANWRKGNWNINTANAIQLSVSPKGHMDIQSDERMISQWLRSLDFSITERISGTYIKKKSRLNIPLQLDYKRQNIHTILSEGGTMTMDNHGMLDHYKAVLSPQYEYTASQLNIRTILATYMDYLNYQNRKGKADDSQLLFSFCPEASVNYKLTPQAMIVGRVAYKRSLGDLCDFLLSPIRTDVLSERLSSGILSDDKTFTAKLRFSYKFPISQWFFNADFSFRSIRSNLITSQVVSNNLIRYVEILQPHSDNRMMISANATKRFQSINTKISVSGQFSHSRQKVMQNSMLIDYTSENLTLLPSLSSKPIDLFEVKYDGVIRRASSKYRETRKTLWQQDHHLKFILSPWKTFIAYVAADIVKRDINANLSKTVVLSDCGISFRRKALRYALNLNNIFNQRHYSYSEYNMVNTYSFNYDLRGRELLFSITFTK